MNPKRYRGEHGQLRLPAVPLSVEEAIKQAQHIVVGAAPVGLLFLGLSPAAWMLFIGILAYQVTEQWLIRDSAYRDIRGYLLGLGAAMLAWAVWEIL